MSSVEISVIVTCYKRRQFVSDAIASVESQSLSRDMFEILLVTDDSAQVESALDCSQLRVIQSGALAYGAFLWPAIKAARGRVLAFLDDDDIWHPSHLETVLRAFESHSDLVYFHNAVEFINSSGELIEEFKVPRSLKAHASNRNWRVPRVLRNRFLATGPTMDYFNDSSVAIRRSLLIDNEGYFRRVEKAEDSFFFYLALASGGSLEFDRSRLTRYRIHSSRPVSNHSAVHNLDHSVERTTRELRTFALLVEMLSRKGTSAMVRLVERDYYYDKILNQVQGTEVCLREQSASLIGLASRANLGNVILNLSVLTLGLIQGLSPRIARQVYLVLRS